MQNNKTHFFYVLYSDKSWVFDQSEGAHGSIYILIKNIKQTTVINTLKHAFYNASLTFRVLVNIHFQKYNRYKFLESYLYCNNAGLEPREKTFEITDI